MCVYPPPFSLVLFPRLLCDFNARGFKADKKTHIFCSARATVNTKRNEIKRKVNRWRARALERESESTESGRGWAKGKGIGRICSRRPRDPDPSVGRSFATRRAFSMHHGENTVTAKSRAPMRKAYIRGTRFITRLTHVIERIQIPSAGQKIVESIWLWICRGRMTACALFLHVSTKLWQSCNCWNDRRIMQSNSHNREQRYKFTFR